MSALKTLPSIDEPRVLLIGAEPWLISQTSLLFAPHHIAVTALSESDFLEIDVKKIDLTTVYKTIWWLEFSKTALNQKVLQKLAQISEIPMMILGRLPEEFLLEHEDASTELKTQQQLLETVVDTLPAAQFFFARDWFEVNEPVGPMALALRGMSNQLFLDPELDWFFSTREGFFEVVSPSLIRPHSPARVIVRGKKIMSTILLKKFARLYNRYYQSDFSVIPVVASRRSPSLLGFVEVAYPEAIDALLDEFTRRKTQWQSLVRSLPSFTSPGKSVTKPAERKQTVEEAELLQPRAVRAAKSEQIKKILMNQEKSGLKQLQEGKMEGELTRIFQDSRSQKSEKRIDDKVRIVKKIAKKSRKNKALFYGGLATMVVGGIVLFLWGAFMVTTALSRRELSEFLTDATAANTQEYSSGRWSQLLQFQASQYQRFFDEETLGEGGELAQLELSLLGLQQQKKQLSLLTEQYFLGILGQGETSPVFPPDLTDQIVATQQTLGKLTLEVESMIQLQPEDQTDWLSVLKEQQQQLALFSQFPDVFTEIFGGRRKMTYAVLLQNNLELRPTGGFIQAVAFLAFDKGLLVDSQVVDVYELDNRLPGTVQAPSEIQRYLGEGSWYLRDSNWNPDYALSAQRSAWFIQQATGFRVDGVWAMNYEAIREILQAFDSMELSEYDEVLTADNLLERVEFHSDDELASADPDKKEYAVAVLTQLLSQIKETSPGEAGKILVALARGLQSKQVLVSFTATSQQEAMRKLEWSGEVITPICPTQFSQLDCIIDQVFQVEANIGLNRVNEYVRRETRHTVDFSGEKITHTRTVTVENAAPSQGWPLGNYKAYFRFLLDQEAQPLSATVNGKKVTGENLMVYGEGGRKVIGVPIEVPPKAKGTLEISYVTDAVPITPFSYLLFNQKQSGVEESPITITFHNPTGKAPTLIAPTAQLFGSSLEFTVNQADHVFVGASFQ